MMGFSEWLERKKEEARVRNQAKSDALKAYYQSDEYKKDIAAQQKVKMNEGKGDFSSWLKRVSNNAAKNLNNETLSTNNINRFLGNDKKKGDE